MEQSILSEYGVIGSLLVDPTLFPEASGLSEDDFTLAPLREVFRAMRRQFAENGSFDALTVRAEAGQHCPEVTDKLLLKSTPPPPRRLLWGGSWQRWEMSCFPPSKPQRKR